MSLFVKNYLHIYSYTFCVVYIIYNIQHIIHVIESMYVYACVNFSLSSRCRLRSFSPFGLR